jgi:hypothetical protein
MCSLKKNKSKENIDIPQYYNRNGKLTVIAFDFIEPIASLYKILIEQNNSRGFAHSIILLTVMMIESI